MNMLQVQCNSFLKKKLTILKIEITTFDISSKTTGLILFKIGWKGP